MNKSIKNRAVVRDPGTIFVCWDTEALGLCNKDCLLVACNIATGEKSVAKISQESGSHYLHSLTPDTYYSIAITEYIPAIKYYETIIDFGILHTFKSSISNISDNTEKWKTDLDSLLRLTGEHWQDLTSSNGHYKNEL